MTDTEMTAHVFDCGLALVVVQNLLQCGLVEEVVVLGLTRPSLSRSLQHGRQVSLGLVTHIEWTQVIGGPQAHIQHHSETSPNHYVCL